MIAGTVGGQSYVPQKGFRPEMGSFTRLQVALEIMLHDIATVFINLSLIESMNPSFWHVTSFFRQPEAV